MALSSRNGPEGGQRPNTLPEVPTVLNVLAWVCVHQVTVAGCTNLRPKTAT